MSTEELFRENQGNEDVFKKLDETVELIKEVNKPFTSWMLVGKQKGVRKEFVDTIETDYKDEVNEMNSLLELLKDLNYLKDIGQYAHSTYSTFELNRAKAGSNTISVQYQNWKTNMENSNKKSVTENYTNSTVIKDSSLSDTKIKSGQIIQDDKNGPTKTLQIAAVLIAAIALIFFILKHFKFI